MGGDSSRRFYGGGRPRVHHAPLPPHDAPPPKTAARKNAQRQRRRRELREEDEAEGALENALDVLRKGTPANTAEAAARALVRMCSDADRRLEMGRRGAVQILVAAMTAADASLVVPCCQALSKLCGSAEGHTRQDEMVAADGLSVLMAILATFAESPWVVTAACRVLERMAVGLNAAVRREAAARAGALALMVRLNHQWDQVPDNEMTIAATRAALRSLTRDSAGLHQIALAAGAEPRWLL